MFNDVAMCCGDVMLMLWVRCWILSCCLNVQWCGHVLWRCGVRVMGTVLDFELLYPSRCGACYGYNVSMEM